MSNEGSPLALVMGGGGARAAYQVGVLRAIARRRPKLEIPILVGVSAGAINTAFLAGHNGAFDEKMERLAELWLGLSTEKVFRSDSLTLLRNATRWGMRLVSGGRAVARRPRGMVDTAPLREFLRASLVHDEGALLGIAENLRHGGLNAVGITTIDYATGQNVTHVQSNGATAWRRPHRRSVETALTIEHVMASAALPLFFPAVRLGESWHGDGGMGLTAPLSPALHLGARRILAISTRFERTHVDETPAPAHRYPPPAQIVGMMLNAVFLDMLDQDALNLERINRLIEHLPLERRGGLQVARLMLLRPSRNISELAAKYEPRLPQPFRFLMRGTGTTETRAPESLSMVMFEPNFERDVIAMGEGDAEKRMDEILLFLDGEERPSVQMTGFWRV